MPETRQGRDDHRAVEVFERCARIAARNGVPVDRVERLITAAVIEDAAVRFWERRGYAVPSRREDSAKDLA